MKADRVLVDVDWDRRAAYERRVAGERVDETQDAGAGPR